MNYLIGRVEKEIRDTLREVSRDRAIVLFIVNIKPCNIQRKDAEHGSEPLIFRVRAPLHKKTTRKRKTICVPEQVQYFTRAPERAFQVSIGACILPNYGEPPMVFQSVKLGKFDATTVHIPSMYGDDAGWDLGLNFDKKGFLESVVFEHDPTMNPELTEEFDDVYVEKMTSEYRQSIRYTAKQY